MASESSHVMAPSANRPEQALNRHLSVTDNGRLDGLKENANDHIISKSQTRPFYALSAETRPLFPPDRKRHVEKRPGTDAAV